MGNNLCCSEHTAAENCGTQINNEPSLKSLWKKSSPLNGDFYVTLKEVEMTKKFVKSLSEEDGVPETEGSKFQSACVSFESTFGQVYRVTKPFSEVGISAKSNGRVLPWEETFKVSTCSLGSTDTVVLKFLKAIENDQK